MAVVESLYPYVLAGLNMTSGWLLYDFLDTNLGAVLLAVGVVLILAVTSLGKESESNLTLRGRQ